MGARGRCRLTGCEVPVLPVQARAFDGCCSVGHAAQVEFLESAQADPPTDPVLAVPGPVSSDAAARTGGRRRGRVVGWVAVAVLLLAGVGLYLRGVGAPVTAAGHVVAPSSSAGPAAVAPGPAAGPALDSTTRAPRVTSRRAVPRTSVRAVPRSSSRRTTSAPAPSADPTLTELSRRVREMAAH